MSDILFIKCNFCNRECNGYRGLSAHIHTHNITAKQYYDNFFKKDTDGICKHCGKETSFLDINRGYRLYCSDKCAVNDPDYINTVQNTKLLKYGSKTYNNREKSKRTCLEKYGTEIYNSIPDIHKKCLETYGVEHYKQVDIFKEKAKQTTLAHYGVEYYTQTKECKERVKQTNLNKYGVQYYTQSDEYRNDKTHIEKYKQTCLLKYGVENAALSNEIKYKSKKKYLYNNLIFDSSWELAYYIWLIDHNIEFEYHPKIFFEYTFNNVIHKYYPDFLINDKYYEIKGDNLYNQMLIENTVENSKYKCLVKNNVILLLYNDIKPYLDYIKQTYETNYLKQFKK